MVYLHCADCGNIFPEDRASEIQVDWGNGTKAMYACPDCGSIEITEAGECGICGEPIDPDEEYCDDCKWEVRKIWGRAVEEVMARREDFDYCDAESAFIEFLQDDMGVI